MGKSDYQYYQTSGGSPAPILWYASLPDHVKRLYDHKATFSQQPALMVILAEVVCEAFTLWALEELFKKKNVEDLWRTLSAGSQIRRIQDICNKRVNKIYTALSGDRITDAAFWQKLQQHNERRNALVHPVHNGLAIVAMPSGQEAEESFKAVEDYIQHVHKVLGSI
ncbi:MAG TPA: hypothetical protein VN657_10725 [Nitrospiraceae bacterium]|jgi:hypothetical protein|nr:hypothetical protein [Nitrospiraceae bacterium]